MKINIQTQNGISRHFDIGNDVSAKEVTGVALKMAFLMKITDDMPKDLLLSLCQNPEFKLFYAGTEITNTDNILGVNLLDNTTVHAFIPTELENQLTNYLKPDTKVNTSNVKPVQANGFKLVIKTMDDFTLAMDLTLQTTIKDIKMQLIELFVPNLSAIEKDTLYQNQQVNIHHPGLQAYDDSNTTIADTCLTQGSFVIVSFGQDIQAMIDRLKETASTLHECRIHRNVDISILPTEIVDHIVRMSNPAMGDVPVSHYNHNITFFPKESNNTNDNEQAISHVHGPN